MAMGTPVRSAVPVGVVDMPPKTASSGEHFDQGTMGPGDSSIDSNPNVVPQPQRYRPWDDLNGQPDERGHYHPSAQVLRSCW